jgi:chromate transporter
VAHIGYFRREFVDRRRWLDEAGFAERLALCQFLPGPASSQFGFAVGYLRGGLAGAAAAWLGFTLPSAVLMLLFAGGFGWWPDLADAGWLHGLKVAAVAVVAQAVWQMGRVLCPDRPRLLLAAAALGALLAWSAAWVQLAVIAGGALGGWAILRNRIAMPPPAVAGGADTSRRRRGLVWLGVFAALLVGLPLAAAATGGGWVALVDRFYRVGALVFGGGHVVLPLLEAEVVNPGWLSHDTFLAGYGAAQALPGPLFSFAAYLGAVSNVGPGGVSGGLLALGAIFLPGLLLVLGAWPFWQRLRGQPAAQAALRGANAAVVGVLAAAFCRPVLPAGVTDARSLALALALFAGLQWAKVPAWAAVAASAAAGWLWL